MSEKNIKILEWSSTFILLFGILLTAVNIYPLNVYIQLIGNAGWALVGILWKKWSLLVIQIVACIIYLFGVIYSYYGMHA
jgi:hypothetical protein